MQVRNMLIAQEDFVDFLGFWLVGYIGFSKIGVYTKTPGVFTEMTGVFTKPPGVYTDNLIVNINISLVLRVVKSLRFVLIV